MRVFFSYAHVDERFRKRLDVHLSSLKQRGLISGWSDHEILAGSEFDKSIRSELETAKIILLLVSPDFIASPYIQSVELKRAIERHKLGEARVIPIILRPTSVHGCVFMKLKCLPKDALPVTDRKWRSQDVAFQSIAEGIEQVVKEMSEMNPQQEANAGTVGATADGWPMPTEWISAQRCLDAGVAKEIAVGESREVFAWIRRPDTKALGELLLERDQKLVAIRADEFTPNSDDFITAQFTVRFPVGREGPGREMQILRLKVELLCPGLEIEESPTIVSIPRESDSEVVTFLIRNSTLGLQTLKLRVVCDDEKMVSMLLRTRFVAHGGPEDKGPSGGVMRVEKDASGKNILVLAEARLHVSFVPLTRVAGAQ